VTRALFAILFAAGLALVGSGQEKKPEEKVPEEKMPEKKPEPFAPGFIQGEYAITSGTHDGIPFESELIRDVVVRVSGDRIVATNRDRSELLNATYKLDNKKFPWAVEMKMTVPKEGTSSGLAVRAGDELTLVYSLPGEEAPQDVIRDPQRGIITKKGQTALVMRVLSIEGGYTIASAERDGQPIPASTLKDSIVRVTGGKIVGTDRDRTEFLSATYTINVNKNPWEIELKVMGAKDGTARGLVKRDGNTLTLIYAQPGAEAPKEFKTKEGQVMLSLRGFILDPLPPPNKFSSSP
jgi:uncharacterized protein (TIGR03067 family)